MNFERQKDEMKNICKNLLSEGRIRVIIGFTDSESDMGTIPFFMRNSDDVDKLKWDNTCTPNLAKYLLEKKDGVAIIAKPCDARAIVMYMIENQISRESIYIIGVECDGMKCNDGMPAPGCKECRVKTPPVYDVLIKSVSIESLEFKAEACSKAEVISEVRAITVAEEVASTEESSYFDSELLSKLERFQNEIKKCILCYSCRQACYGCYCETCFMDRNLPNWLPSELDTGSKMTFHLGRAMHLAGRCVECGACERVCPSGVDIRYLIKEITQFGELMYDYQAGLDADEVPALLSFKQNDREVGFWGGEGNDSCCGAEKPVK